MYPLAPENARQRSLLVGLRKRLKAAGVPASKIQPFTLKAFAKLANNSNYATFNFSDNKPVLSGENLLPNQRILIANVVGMGVARVPASGTAPNIIYQSGNRTEISYPHASVFSTPKGSNTVSEVDAVRMFFNGTMVFKIDQADQMDEFLVSNFQVLEQTSTEIPLGIKPIDMHTTFIVSGGKDNTLTVKYPEGDYSQIAGPTGFQNFGVCIMSGFVIATSEDVDRAKVAKSLAG